MNRVTLFLGRQRQDLLGIEIGAGTRAPQQTGDVGPPGVKRAVVVLGEDGGGANAELGCSPHHPYGNLTSIGDQKVHRNDSIP